MNEQPLIAELTSDKASAYHQYLDIFVGEESALALLRYELLTGILGSMPGALGYFLRAKLYPSILGRMGRRSVVGRGVTIRSPRRISIGEGVMVDDFAVLDAKGATSTLELGNQLLVGRNTILSCNEATIRIGNFVSIGPFCFFASKSRIDVGSNVSIGSGTHLMAGGHAFDAPYTPIIKQKRLAQGITIEDGVWIGTGTRVLDGVTVGQNSIVGAGAVVTENVPAESIAVGVPARVIRHRNR
jgi:acetyltransferase-like isoleucine patch superfamily enzyme